MAKFYRKYRDFNFSKTRRELIDRINTTIDIYEEQGIYHLSVRQIYYNLVGKGMDNTAESYGRVKSAINDGRLAGLIAWDVIEDRNRGLSGLQTWDTPQDRLKDVLYEYRNDLWASQPFYPEVWVEKAALEGVVGSICDELRVNFMALRGYNSQSEQWRASQRFAKAIERGQQPIVFHLGDHDPSGLDMTRDNKERLEMFVGIPVMVQRLGLNMNQVEQYNPPPNYTKSTDVRTTGYEALFGTDECWELDALDPLVIQELISDAVNRIRDESAWDKALLQETTDIREIKERMASIGVELEPDPEEDGV
jgi:hypothetical protein